MVFLDKLFGFPHLLFLSLKNHLNAEPLKALSNAENLDN